MEAAKISQLKRSSKHHWGKNVAFCFTKIRLKIKFCNFDEDLINERLNKNLINKKFIFIKNCKKIFSRCLLRMRWDLLLLLHPGSRSHCMYKFYVHIAEQYRDYGHEGFHIDRLFLFAVSLLSSHKFHWYNSLQDSKGNSSRGCTRSFFAIFLGLTCWRTSSVETTLFPLTSIGQQVQPSKN